MNDLQRFYKETKIPGADQKALGESAGIKDMESLRENQKALYRKALTGVSDLTQGKLRALLHFLEYNEKFDKMAFHKHFLIHTKELDELAKQKLDSKEDKKNPTPSALALSCPQGFDSSADDVPDETEEDVEDYDLLFDGGPEDFVFAGVRFKRGRCYHHDNGSDMFGIRAFIIREGSTPRAICSLILPMSQTFLGEGRNDTYTLYGSQYCQVRQEGEQTVPLSALTNTVTEPKVMPKLCYKPQKKGGVRDFAYFFDKDQFQRVGLRGTPKVIELFCGSGGMHQGYKACGFETIKAIDKDELALKTFRHNNPEAAEIAECVCVNEFLSLYKRNGTAEVLHASPPCQGFSKANRTGGKNDHINNELALSFPEGLRRTKALVGIFENVEGIWSGKGMPYLLRMLNQLVEMKYQFRVMVLRACDYGDPQPRPRFIIVAARSFIPLPLMPISTHTNPNSVQYKKHRDGSTKPTSLTTIGRRLDAEHSKAPWVVAGDVLEMFLHIPKDHFPNMSDRKFRKNPSSTTTTTTDAAATSDPDDSSSTNNGTAATHNKVEEEVKEVFADQLASAIMASGPPVWHYAADATTGDRKCLSVRDVAALQSYPNGYEFFGTLQQKYKQVGNSVPCGLATALARSAATVLRFVYRGEDDPFLLPGGDADTMGSVSNEQQPSQQEEETHAESFVMHEHAGEDHVVGGGVSSSVSNEQLPSQQQQQQEEAAESFVMHEHAAAAEDDEDMPDAN